MGGDADKGKGLEAAAFDTPRVFGRILLLKLLARGGMGDVYLAATTGIEGAERPCIVKTIRRDHIHDGSFLARFLDEARVQSQLTHPGVAQVLEATVDENGEPFTVVEYVEGRSLSDLRQRVIQSGTRVGWPEAVAIGIEMAVALAYVHDRASGDGTPLGIVHRDLSPQNVMIGYSGDVKLIDFGTARGHNRKCHTVAGVVFAKPGYVAPEVARQQIGDGRIDVYALGIMLWELVAGRRYITGDAQKHLEEAAAGKLTLPKLAKDFGAPDKLDEILEKLTHSDPDDRYTNATQAAGDLGKLLAFAPPGPGGERSVRGRVATLMHALWPQEPARSRAEFVKLLKEARRLRRGAETPSSPDIAEKAAEHMNDGAGILGGTPYRLSDRIGEGASGVVWSAEHMELGRNVAIKLLTQEHASAKDAIDRFRREARTVASLSHPNLVSLYDFGKATDGRVFLAMELLEGEPLDKLVKARTVGWREAVSLAIQATRALEAAHSAGLVHRDLKPANLFLTDQGVLKLLDFGVAMAVSDVAAEEKKQRGFAIFGTPEYMAPEQIGGESVDGRCDIYALGCVLYELITGARAFSGRSSVEVLGKQVREEAMAPQLRAPERDIPDEVEAIVTRAMRKPRSERFASAGELRDALEAVLAPKVIEAPKKRALGKQLAAFAAVAAVIALVTHAGVGAAPRPDSIADVSPDPTMVGPAALPLPADGTPEVLPQISGVVPPPTPSADQNGAEPNRPPTRSTPKERLASARDAAKAHPSDARLLHDWAKAAMKAGDLKEARRAADAWLLHDASPEPKLFLASVLDASGKRTEAKAIVEEVLEVWPDSNDARKLHAKLGSPLPAPDTSAKRTAVARN
ncbi:hypothetical protein BH09MYX1_BH09MYX1_17000 [soil metagenome]